MTVRVRTRAPDGSTFNHHPDAVFRAPGYIIELYEDDPEQQFIPVDRVVDINFTEADVTTLKGALATVDATRGALSLSADRGTSDPSGILLS